MCLSLPMLTAEKTQDLPTESKKPPATDDVQRPATDDVLTPATDDVQSPATDDVQSPATDDVQTVEPLKVIHVHHSLTAAGITTCICPSGFLPVTLHSFLPLPVSFTNHHLLIPPLPLPPTFSFSPFLFPSLSHHSTIAEHNCCV